MAVFEFVDPDEQGIMLRPANWLSDTGQVQMRGDLRFTDRQMFFLNRGWRREGDDWYPRLRLEWSGLDTLVLHPVKKDCLIVVTTRPGPPIPRDDWNRRFPPREPHAGRYRLLMQGLPMYDLEKALNRVGLVEGKWQSWTYPQ